MTIGEIIRATDATALTNPTDESRAIACGYSCDLLSWVMAHGKPGMAWITVQTHMNVVAVATLHDMHLVIVPEGGAVPPDVVKKAEEEDIAMISSPMTAFEISGILYAAGVSAR
ncbi:MAG: AraC family transcriptional regulator [Christensenellales bacterium]|jgi:hypothetical protein